MDLSEQNLSAVTGRREPPRFRQLNIVGKSCRSGRMVRVTLGGRELEGLEIDEPAASVRLLLPSPGSAELSIPAWNGNEFLLSDGTRPLIRTFTPRHLDTTSRRLDLDVVIHEGGMASEWVDAAAIGDPVALSGPGRGYSVDQTASGFLLAGDESAIPAISQLMEAIPAQVPTRVHLEIVDPSGRQKLPAHPGAVVDWHVLTAGSPPGETLVAAVAEESIDADMRIWCAGEAASMHRMRSLLFKNREIRRDQATVRGYWKLVGPSS